MTPYTQVTPEERFALSLLRRQGLGIRAMARVLRRAPSTISREIRRNIWHEDRRSYLPRRAQAYTNARRRRARRHSQFTAAEWAQVEARLRQDWSPEQIAGRFRRTGALRISHETIYRHVWRDWRQGGTLRQHLRGARKQRRKRYGAYDSRGRLAGKRHISTRPVGSNAISHRHSNAWSTATNRSISGLVFATRSARRRPLGSSSSTWCVNFAISIATRATGDVVEDSEVIAGNLLWFESW
jgi:IS30 family transposase